MITLCPGWGAPHDVPIVLDERPEAPDGISHGMCPACDAAMNPPPVAERRGADRISETRWAELTKHFGGRQDTIDHLRANKVIR